MMQRRLTAPVLLLVIMAASAFAQPMAVDQAALDAVVSEAMAYWKTPGAAVVIVRDDRVIYLKGFGVRDVTTQQPVTPDTVFAIGSTTKAFTTAAMAILVDEGRMGWDDPVRKHLPTFRLSNPLANEAVTLRDIVSHRTGLVRHDLLWYGSPLSRAEIIRRIGYVPLSYPFRTTFQYQNIMFLAAGEAVAAAAGESYESFVRKRIFAPLGMKSANFSTADAEKADDHASPHIKTGEAVNRMAWRNIDNVGPAGSINASARDLSNWLRMHLNDGATEGRRLISAGALRAMRTPHTPIELAGRWKIFFPESDVAQLSYGLGWFINDYRGQQLVMHGGTIDGFRASVVLVPRARLGLAVLANLNASQMPEAVGYNLVDILLGLRKKDWNALISNAAKSYEAEQAKAILGVYAKRQKDAKPTRELAAFTGVYEDEAYGKVEVTVSGNQLLLKWNGSEAKFEHFHYDTFIAKQGLLAHERATFVLDADGEVSELKLLNTTFKKAKTKP